MFAQKGCHSQVLVDIFYLMLKSFSILKNSFTFILSINNKKKHIMSKHLSALDAKFEAQKLAFAPFYFQAMISIKELGILDIIAQTRKGLLIEEIVEKTGLSLYGIKVLVEAGLCMDILEQTEEGRYLLTTVGSFVRSDRMTEVNMNFANDVCYAGLANLTESIVSGKPEGLKVFGNWPTVYQGLSQLPEKVKKSWFEFDHFYSDDAFPTALELVFREPPKNLFDIGGNTGKWAKACCNYNQDVHIKMLDLPGQLNVAKENMSKELFNDRVSYYEIDLLDDNQAIPKGADAVWMSQFLDCFGDNEILSILKRVYDAVDEKAFVYILEPFWNNQRFPASAFCLVGTSLYFTCIANGNSKMYHAEEMKKMSVDTGFEVVDTFELIGDSYHTLLKLKKSV